MQKFLEQHYHCSIIYSTLIFIVLNYKQHYSCYDTDEKLELATNTGVRLITDIVYFVDWVFRAVQTTVVPTIVNTWKCNAVLGFALIEEIDIWKPSVSYEDSVWECTQRPLETVSVFTVATFLQRRRLDLLPWLDCYDTGEGFVSWDSLFVRHGF